MNIICKILVNLAIVSCLLLLSSCSRDPSETDMARLKLIENKYSAFEFRLVDELYLNVKLRKETLVSEKDLREVYRIFFFEDTSNCLRNTTFIYLNFYDYYGNFQYQIAFDAKKNTFIKSRTEHY